MVERSQTLGRRPGALGSHFCFATNFVSLDDSLSESEVGISCIKVRNVDYIFKIPPTS